MMAVLAGLSTTAMADGLGGRFGVSVGRETLKADDYGLDAHSTAWEVFGGYEFNKYLAIEAGYIDGTTAKQSIPGGALEIDASGYYGSVVGSLPFAEVFSVYGRAGYLHWKADEYAHADGGTANGSVNGDDPIFGVGIAYEGEGNALLRLEYRIADLDDTDLSLISVGIAWRF
jgi:OOP family OmpA-OmpF porin